MPGPRSASCARHARGVDRPPERHPRALHRRRRRHRFLVDALRPRPRPAHAGAPSRTAEPGASRAHRRQPALRSTRCTPRVSSTATSSPPTPARRRPRLSSPTSAWASRCCPGWPDPLGSMGRHARLRRAGADPRATASMPAPMSTRSAASSTSCSPAAHRSASRRATRRSSGPTSRAPADPTALQPRLPPEFDAVIDRAIAKAPADRYPSTGDLGRAALGGGPRRGPRQRERWSPSAPRPRADERPPSRRVAATDGPASASRRPAHHRGAARGSSRPWPGSP